MKIKPSDFDGGGEVDFLARYLNPNNGLLGRLSMRRVPTHLQVQDDQYAPPVRLYVVYVYYHGFKTPRMHVLYASTALDDAIRFTNHITPNNDEVGDDVV